MTASSPISDTTKFFDKSSTDHCDYDEDYENKVLDISATPVFVTEANEHSDSSKECGKMLPNGCATSNSDVGAEESSNCEKEKMAESCLNEKVIHKLGRRRKCTPIWFTKQMKNITISNSSFVKPNGKTHSIKENSSILSDNEKISSNKDASVTCNTKLLIRKESHSMKSNFKMLSINKRHPIQSDDKSHSMKKCSPIKSNGKALSIKKCNLIKSDKSLGIEKCSPIKSEDKALGIKKVSPAKSNNMLHNIKNDCSNIPIVKRGRGRPRKSAPPNVSLPTIKKGRGRPPNSSAHLVTVKRLSPTKPTKIDHGIRKLPFVLMRELIINDQMLSSLSSKRRADKKPETFPVGKSPAKCRAASTSPHQKITVKRKASCPSVFSKLPNEETLQFSEDEVQTMEPAPADATFIAANNSCSDDTSVLIDNKRYMCDFCAFTTTNSSSIKKHRARHTGEGMMKCPLCSYQTIHQYLMKVHSATYHTGEGLEHCLYCDFKTARKERYRYHLGVHVKKGEAPHDAVAAFTKRCALAMREQRIAGKKRTKSEMLPLKKRVSTEQNLVHNNEGNLPVRSASVASSSDSSNISNDQENCEIFDNSECTSCDCNVSCVMCTECDYITFNVNTLAVHKLEHKREVMFCEFCSFSTSDRTFMDIHLANHNGIRTALCPFCDYSSSDQYLMRCHIAEHRSGHSAPKAFLSGECLILNGVPMDSSEVSVVDTSLCPMLGGCKNTSQQSESLSKSSKQSIYLQTTGYIL